jgi:hypothetical protein
MDQTTLARDFDRAFGAFWGNGTKQDFYDFFDDRALMIDEDNPIVMDKPAFVDHIEFHLSGIWESMNWKPRQHAVAVFDGTGLVSGQFTFRGKPKNSGYRQRHGNFSVVCYWDTGTKRWRGAKLHLSPLLSHIYHNSPA